MGCVHLWETIFSPPHLPTASLVVQLVKNLPAMQETWVQCPGIGKIPWRRKWLLTPVFLGFPGGSDGKKSTRNVGDLDSIPGLGRSPGEGEGLPTPVFLRGKFHGQRSLAGYNPWDDKESDMTFTFFHATWETLLWVLNFICLRISFKTQTLLVKVMPRVLEKALACSWVPSALNSAIQ